MMSSLRSAFYFTIPSLADATPLDCRIYTSNTPGQWNKGAIIAHPYAPLGGSYDDPVVMSLVSLLAQEMVVVTFNFRGAGTSKGKTSWTGKAEREDYTAVIGLLTHYLRHLEVEESGHGQLDLLLAGYSYGSLILSQLLPIATILQTFVSPPTGTPQSEILLRARTLADQTSVLQDIPTDRGRTLSPVKAGRSHRKSNSHSGPIIMGGEESPEVSRTSREGRRSLDIVRKTTEVPKRLRSAVRRQSSNQQKRATNSATPPAHPTIITPSQDKTASSDEFAKSPHVKVRYLLVSPLLPPISHLLCPSSKALFPFRDKDGTDTTLTSNPTLFIFGSADVFTSSRKLRPWAQKLQDRSSKHETRPNLEWHEVDGAGHFWREDGAIEELRETVMGWVAPR